MLRMRSPKLLLTRSPKTTKLPLRKIPIPRRRLKMTLSPILRFQDLKPMAKPLRRRLKMTLSPTLRVRRSPRATKLPLRKLQTPRRRLKMSLSPILRPQDLKSLAKPPRRQRSERWESRRKLLGRQSRCSDDGCMLDGVADDHTTCKWSVHYRSKRNLQRSAELPCTRASCHVSIRFLG